MRNSKPIRTTRIGAAFRFSGLAPPRPRALERVTAGADRHRLRGFLRTLARAGAEAGVALRTGVSVVPPMLVDGAVAANVGRLCARTCVNASYPEASLMRVGSLKALPKKLIPRGTPNTMPAGTWTMG